MRNDLRKKFKAQKVVSACFEPYLTTPNFIQTFCKFKKFNLNFKEMNFVPISKLDYFLDSP